MHEYLSRSFGTNTESRRFGTKFQFRRLGVNQASNTDLNNFRIQHNLKHFYPDASGLIFNPEASGQINIREFVAKKTSTQLYII